MINRIRLFISRYILAAFVGISVGVVLLAGAGMPRSSEADQVGVINHPEVVRAHRAFLMGVDPLNPRTPIGPDPGAVEAHEKRLKSLRERLARERSSLSPEEKKRLEEAIRDEAAALQTLYAKNTKDAVDRLRWTASDIFFPYLRERIQEFGRERGLGLIVNQADGRPIYQDPARSGEVAGERADLTKELIEWLRRKGESAPDGTPPLSGR